MHCNRPMSDDGRSCSYSPAQIFFISVGLVLITTSLTKVISSFGSASLLETPDPLLSLPYRPLLRFAAATELLTLSLLISKSSEFVKAMAVGWIAPCLHVTE